MDNERINITSCPICSNTSLGTMGIVDGRTITKCGRCSHRFASSYIPVEILDSYEAMYYSSPDDPRIDEWIMKNEGVWEGLCRDLTRCLPQPRSLLDVGAGTGGFVLKYCENNPNARVFVIEQSTNAIESLKKKADGITFIRGTAEDLGSCTETFDAITFLQVLEHLPEPISVLRHSRDHLNDGGGLFITVPNAFSYRALQKGLQDGYCYTNSTHLHFFTTQSIAEALRSAGFTDFKRIVSYGGSNTAGVANIAQYAARRLGISTELRYIAYKR